MRSTLMACPACQAQDFVGTPRMQVSGRPAKTEGSSLEVHVLLSISRFCEVAQQPGLRICQLATVPQFLRDHRRSGCTAKMIR